MKSYKNNKNNKNIKIGGKVIASGGYGCVFNPALKCKGKEIERNKISKLMTKRHAISEYNEIQDIKKKINGIANYKNYFLVDDFTICTPDTIQESDLENYEKKCTALPKDDIKKDNINKSLDKMLLLNMPNGGIPVDDYIYDDGSFDKLTSLNISLINLLNNGIVPMNAQNIYHCDIKDSNILVKVGPNKTIETRLIDWGLSTMYTPHVLQQFPKPWKNRPLQYNVPFSSIIFTDLFVEKYTNYLKKHKKLTYVNLKPFVLEYIYLWIKKRGSGHYKFINSIMYMLFSNEMQNIEEKTRIRMIETEFTLLMITNYIIEVLIHFTKFKENGELNLREYLDNVFIKIIDIWGFIMVFFPLLEILFNSYKKLTQHQLKIFNQIKMLFLIYCYNPRIKPIDLISLNKDLAHLNELIRIEQTNTDSENKIPLNNTLQKISVSGETFFPSSTTKSSPTKSYFIKQKKSTSKKIKNLILVPNKNKTKKIKQKIIK